MRSRDLSGREDAAGRPIPHEFVVYPPLALEIHSVADALEEVWPLVAEDYETIWDSQHI